MDIFNLKTTTKKKILPYFLILPGVIAVALVLIYPLINGVISSFLYKQNVMSTESSFVGFANYLKLFSDEIFKSAFVNTIIWTSTVVLFEFIIGLIVALLLNENFPGRSIYRGLILIPWIVPRVVAALTWKWMYAKKFGIINYIFKMIGILDKNVAWLGDTTLAFPAVIVTQIWKGVPFIAIVLLAGLQSIPPELYEVAAIEGANMWHKFWYITLPQLKSVSLIAVLLSCIWTFNQFDLIYVMTKGGPANSTQIISVYTYLTAFNFFDLNYAAAIGCIGLIILGIFAAFYLKTSKLNEVSK